MAFLCSRSLRLGNCSAGVSVVLTTRGSLSARFEGFKTSRDFREVGSPGQAEVAFGLSHGLRFDAPNQLARLVVTTRQAVEVHVVADEAFRRLVVIVMG